jgi:hypothetical protein
MNYDWDVMDKTPRQRGFSFCSARWRSGAGSRLSSDIHPAERSSIGIRAGDSGDKLGWKGPCVDDQLEQPRRKSSDTILVIAIIAVVGVFAA